MRFTVTQRTLLGTSLTPMIDAVFILLLFFLLTARLSPSASVDTTLPLRHAAVTEEAKVPSITLTVLNNRILLDGQEIDAAALRATLARRLADSPELELSVQPAADITLQRLLDVHGLINRSGAMPERISTQLPMMAIQP